ncbi:MAG: hypothetical protein K9G60_13735 [Pseudolabrys sp.]|nr:hypothetical protein [Pseudolabrys sp.]
MATEKHVPECGKISEIDRDENLLRVWERAIQTQMHFAELSIKTRQIGMTVVGATLALAVVLYRTGHQFSIPIYSWTIPVSSILCWTAALVLYAIKLLDIDVYHQMLRGAVAFNEDLEKNHLFKFFGTELGLTEAISYFSRHPGASFKDGSYSHAPATRFQLAGPRINYFYWILISALLLAGFSLFWAGVR